MMVFDDIAKVGGSVLIVGGFVRDRLLGHVPKDMDVEVYGISMAELIKVLEGHGEVDVVGQSFGVIKCLGIDWSLPRKDSKNGVGHTGFSVDVSSNLSVKEAASRRDFTINALGMYPSGEIVDEYNGLKDLNDRVLRATTAAYKEDPLRVLRGFQFCGRFGLSADSRTIEMSNEMLAEYDSIATERIWTEWEKWAAQSIVPSKGLDFLLQSGWIEKYPALSELVNCEQDPVHHPEGTVWQHTKHVCDAMASLIREENRPREDAVILMLAALLHDVGKPNTTVIEGGVIRSPRHAQVGVPIAEDFLIGIGAPIKVIRAVLPLVEWHMSHIGVNFNKTIVRRWSTKVNLNNLALIIHADHNGRPPLPAGLPANVIEMIKIAAELGVGEEKPAPILLGRHLISCGLNPGPVFGQILDAAYEAQINGEFDSVHSAKLWLLSHLKELSHTLFLSYNENE